MGVEFVPIITGKDVYDGYRGIYAEDGDEYL